MAKSLSSRANAIYRFGDCELDTYERRLLVHQQPITLTPKVFDTLVILVERAGHAVSKDELMTLLWPRGFVDESNLTKHIWLIRKALHDDHEAKYIQTVAKMGYRFVASVTIAQPGATAHTKGLVNPANDSVSPEVTRAVDVIAPAGDDVARISNTDSSRVIANELTSARTTSSRRRLAFVSIAAGAAIVAATIAMLWPHRTIPSRTSPPPGTIAIVEFTNLAKNPKDAWLGPALEQMLATEASVGKLHVVADELVRLAHSDLETPTAGGYAPQSLAKLHSRLDAEFVLSGSYVVAGGADAPVLRVDISLQSTQGEGISAAFSREGPIATLPKIVADAGTQLRHEAGIGSVEGESLQRAANAQPPTAEVARRMGFALDALHKNDPARARDELLEAVAQAPDYAPAYSYLAEAWSALGYKTKALAAAKQAADHAGNLPSYERKQIDAQLAAERFDWPQTVNTYRELVELQPQNIDYRLKLMDAQISAGKPSDADVSLNGLRALPDADSDARVEIAASRIALAHDDVVNGTEHARRGLTLAKAHEQPGLIAESELQVGMALNDVAHRDESETLLRRSAADFHQIDNPHGEAHTRQNIANLLLDAGRVPEAREEYQRAMAIYQGMGDLNGVAAIYANVSRVLWNAGDRDGAQTALRQTLSLRRETGDLEGQAWALTGLATIESDDSASDEVAQMYRQAIALDEQTGNPKHHVFATSQYVDVLRVRGDLDQAKTSCEQMEREALTLNDHGVATLGAIFECGEVALDRGDVDEAVTKFQSSLESAKQLGDPMSEANSDMMLAVILMGQQQPEPAREHLQRSAAVFKNAELVTGEATADALLAEIDETLSDAGGRDAARARAAELLKGITERGVTTDVRIALAKLDGLNGKRESALATLHEIAADAEQRHWLETALNAKLAAVQLLDSPPAQVEQPLHKELEEEAQAHGFKWILTQLHALDVVAN